MESVKYCEQDECKKEDVILRNDLSKRLYEINKEHGLRMILCIFDNKVGPTISDDSPLYNDEQSFLSEEDLGNAIAKSMNESTILEPLTIFTKNGRFYASYYFEVPNPKNTRSNKDMCSLIGCLSNKDGKIDLIDLNFLERKFDLIAVKYISKIREYRGN